jgi:hypothetical protein
VQRTVSCRGGSCSDPVAQTGAAVCGAGPFVGCRGGVSADHLPGPPSGEAHEVLLLLPVGEPAMGHGVSELVRVDVADAGGGCPSVEELP